MNPSTAHFPGMGDSVDPNPGCSSPFQLAGSAIRILSLPILSSDTSKLALQVGISLYALKLEMTGFDRDGAADNCTVLDNSQNAI